MQQLNDFLELINGIIGSAAPWFPFALLGTGIFFTIYLKFPQIRYFKYAINVVRGKYDDPNDEGDTSHFQALTTALSGTVGTGNIAGVALAVHIGGPAALFWMLITATIGMCTKFVEVTLSHKYREKAEDGSIAGGPMYFMKNKLNMKWLAVLFAGATVLSSFGTGSLPQINSIASAIKSTFGVQQWITGLVLAVILLLVIVGGIKRIASITEKLVPAMALVYLIGAFAVIFYNFENIVPSFVSIFSDVFSGTAAGGGFLGASIAFAFSNGVGRGLYSNEAGQGSAPIAHAAAKSNEPVSEGLVAILEPFIDTIVICTITGLVLLSSGVWNQKYENEFQYTDMSILVGDNYEDKTEQGVQKLREYISGKSELPTFSGKLTVANGVVKDAVSFINLRSLAEKVKVYDTNDNLYSGEIAVDGGKPLTSDVKFIGKSLVKGAPLTAIAFQKSFFGEWGKYIVSIGLLLFAFSTVISWSYYGDRAMTFLFGSKSVTIYRIAYVIIFFLGSLGDATIIWTLAAVIIAIMTLPNLIGIFLLRKDMKETVDKYWSDFKKEWPNEKTPD